MRLGTARLGTRRLGASTSGVLPEAMPSPVPLRLDTLGTTFLGTCWMGWGPAASPLPPASIFSPHREWAGWLSGVIGQKVQLGRFPKGSPFPRVCYNVVHSETPTYLDGPCRLRKITVQVDAFSDKPESPPALILEAIQDAMGTYRGPTGRSYLDVAIPGTTWSKFYPDGTESGQGIWGESQEWDLWLLR